MVRDRRGVVLSMAAALVCGCNFDDGGALVGTARFSIQQIPADVSCLRFTAQGGRTVQKLFNVMPGQMSSSFDLQALPTGSVTFTADAFSIGCALVISATQADWLSDPVVATVVASPPVEVQLTLRRNGRATVSADFVEDDLGVTLPSDLAITLPNDLAPLPDLRSVDGGLPGG